MKTCFDAKHLNIKYEEINDVLISEWKTPSDITDSEYREIFKSYVEVLKEHKPKNVIVNALKAQYAIPVKTQDWVNQQAYPLYAQFKTERMAIIMSTDFIAQLSFEQVVDDAESNDDIKTMFFDNEESALEWMRGNSIDKRVA